MSSPLSQGQGGIYNGNQEMLAMYAVGDGSNAKQTNLYTNAETTMNWATTNSASYVFANPSSMLMLTASGNNGQILVNFNKNTNPTTSQADFALPTGLVTTIPMKGIQSMVYIANSASIRFNAINFY